MDNTEYKNSLIEAIQTKTQIQIKQTISENDIELTEDLLKEGPAIQNIIAAAKDASGNPLPKAAIISRVARWIANSQRIDLQKATQLATRVVGPK